MNKIEKDLIEKIEKLKKSQIKIKIEERISSFKKILDDFNEDLIFCELCFCIMTANFNAERSIKIQSAVGNDFCFLSQEKLGEKLKKYGHRFPNARAKYISSAQEKKQEIIKKIREEKDELKLREWIAQNVKGLGFKESSHFLRNIGFENFAIIDFHIIDVLKKFNVLKGKIPKTLNKTNYLKVEKLLLNLGKKSSLNMARLDFYLWYLETGKVLK